MTPACPHNLCDGTGFRLVGEPGQGAEECPCRTEKLPLLCRQKAGFPDQYLDATFDNFVPKAIYPAQKEALDGLRAYVESWDEHRALGDCAAILGPTRVGKSHLAIAVARGVMDKVQRSLDEDFVMFINITNWVDRWRRYWIAWPPGTPAEARWQDPDWVRQTSILTRTNERMDAVSLLVLDDLGEVKPDPSILNRIYGVVDHRTSNNLPMVVTANYSWADIASRYGDDGQRIVDRLREKSVDRAYIFEKTKLKRKG